MPYTHIGRIDRQLVSEVQRRKFDCAWIGRIVRKDRATVARELRRNADPDGHYNSHRAQARAHARRCKPRGSKLDKHPLLRQYVIQKLQIRWSPEQISNYLPTEHKDDPKMRISRQAIYNFIEQDKRLADASPWGGKLFKYLLRGGKRYRKRRTKAGRTHIPDRVGIEQRPAEADARDQVGHLEGDTVHGRRTNACLTTLVDRSSRLVRIRRCPNRRAKTVTHATLDALATLTPLKTITFDNGVEFSRHTELTRQTGIQTFFAEPYHSWERGSNENMNGLIRAFFPKGTNFSRVSDEEVAYVEDLLNNRPRKCLGWRTPNQVHFNRAAVALGG